jgi:hypothetical protein
MSTEWRRFLALRVPLAALALAVVCQIAAAALSGVPMRRNRSDEIAAAVSTDRRYHRVLLLGDSVTRDSTSRYALGRDVGDVLNLSTHGALGLTGEYFLLERYLRAHPTPQWVVLSLSPENYFGFGSTEKMHYYMWYTFDRPEERSFLKEHLPDIDRKDHYPAVLDLQERVLERVYGLMQRSQPGLSDPSRFPDATRAVEAPSENLSDAKITRDRIQGDRDAHLRRLEADSLARICELARRDSFQIQVVWPPAPAPVADAFETGGIYRRLEDEITATLAPGGCGTSFFDMNAARGFVNFHRDSMHLLGEGWEERAASDLRGFLSALPGAPSGGDDRASGR